MQSLLLRIIEMLDTLLQELDDVCPICFEEVQSHTPDCELQELIDNINEALEDPFNS